MALAVAACGAGNGGDRVAVQPERPGAGAGPEEVHPGTVHECAGGWPVPGEMAVVETALGRDDGGDRTCVVSVRSDRTVAETVARYRAELDGAGWSYETQQEDDATAVLQLRGPLCGAAIVIPHGSGASVLTSIVDCDRVQGTPATGR